MANYSKEFLERTIQVWQPYTPTPLSLEDGREICDNLCGFFSVLKKWNDQEKEKLEDEGNCGLRSSNNSGEA